MNVNELIERAHANAKDKGFWTPERSNVAEKMALISTEIWELEEELIENLGSALEEVADIAIRAMDLCGYMEFRFDDVSVTHPHLLSSSEVIQIPIILYRLVAMAVQEHRKGQVAAFRVTMGTILHTCYIYSEVLWGGEALYLAIIDKMQKNESRPQLHGNLY